MLTVVRIIEVLILPLVALFFVSVNTIFTVLDLLYANTAFGVVNSVLAIFGGVFLIGLIRHRSKSRQES